MKLLVSLKDLGTYAKNTWCPGCGNFGIERAAKTAFAELINEGVVNREDIVVVAGIGCHDKIVDYINLNSFRSLHGRAITVATGIKIANPRLQVVVFVGDGDAYGEGLEHLVFAAKRNIGIKVIVHDNRVYGLTTGQYTPTSPKGFPGRSTPKGSVEDPLNPVKLLLASGASFVARGYSARPDHLKGLIKQAIMHRGFAVIDVLQPCVTFFDTYKYYNARVYDLQEAGHDYTSYEAAMRKAEEWNYGVDDSGRIPIGIFYKAEKPTYEETILKGKNLLSREPPSIKEALRP
ncbi:thiamine pyrophosphate-dependent enzyme [Thermofilum pendens]|uniref:2-oxoacid oxidoreductase (ferredoxin) n=1 Tax=Thermofilum pendens (strain DSM 2475 / Hrk 5) TaxID=368408 RepID=A1S072_THEPD|nr:thiamine pyrophosphate-dependent enzyme [Thermofilum pendens]ABL78852.1 pyruvate ferredoxin/flavodoxin oxidoreductase, beta subunit [Thermofilum pendens Hrk 5]